MIDERAERGRGERFRNSSPLPLAIHQSVERMRGRMHEEGEIGNG